MQADGKSNAGGQFAGGNSIGGQKRNRIARLDGVTGLADSFDPNANGIVHVISFQADGKISACGSFSIIGGQPRNTFARFSNATGSLQNLSPTPTTLTCTPGASTPPFGVPHKVRGAPPREHRTHLPDAATRGPVRKRLSNEIRIDGTLVD